VIKPSEYSSATSAYMATMIAQIFDPKEITVVQGAVEETKILLDLPWDHIYFTGSTMVGKIIMKAAAERLSSVTLELGGKSPCIIDKSANIASVAKKLTWGKFLNNGQTCIAPDYVLVPKKMKSSLVAELKKEVKTQLDPNGIGSQANEDYGHIISERHHSRCVSLLEDAIQKGAIIITGGEYDASSRFFAPTVLDNVTDDMKIMQEEIFGPILPIIGYTSKEEVINIINDKPKPLALYIQSKDQKSIAFFLENTTAGGTVINDFMIHYANPHLPFGGVNNSGIGKSHGYYGFQEFTNERAVMRQRFGTTSLLHPPFTARSEKLARILGKWLS
jgi:aldehyde dehydrogenase (NAD+)